MAQSGPKFRLLAVVTEPGGRDRKEKTTWIPIGALWETKERGLFTGRINAFPLAWVGTPGASVEVGLRVVEDREREPGDDRDDDRRGRR